jgi:cbb3-type cytochrome oxidase maturation protein
MNAMLLLIPISLVLLGVAIWGFFWAVDHGQFDALDRASLAPLDHLDSPEVSAVSPDRRDLFDRTDD